MTLLALAVASSSTLPPWLQLEQLSPFDAYAQAVGTVMLIIALLHGLCSLYADARALRIFALLYLFTGIGWLVAHPRAYGGAADVPLVPALVAVALIAMNVWGLYEFLGLARRRALALVLGTVAAAALLLLALRLMPGSALPVYGMIAAGFGYCAWLAFRAGRLEGNVGHRYIAIAYATYPALFVLYVALPSWLAGFEMGYYAAVPAMIVGMMVLAVSLIRARRRTGAELQRRVVAEAALRQLNSTLEERVAARTGDLKDLVDGLESFNRNVSHDLRGPLAGISALSQLALLALQGHDEARAGRHLALIHEQSTQMTDMVQDLLLLSRVADAPLQRRRQALGDSVDGALAQLRLDPAMADALQQVRVKVHALPTCDVDADLLRQVFVNLLGNAVKFTAAAAPSGPGLVTVGLHATPRGHAVCVQDNGMGLPADRLDRLFEPFGRLHGDQVRGSGIGLTIARRIVEAHGGSIWAEPGTPAGARFLFTLAGL